MRLKPFVLVVLDGWGVAPPSRGNAISSSRTPHLTAYMREFPALTLQASGEAVGLPRGEPGNSEVGHLALGSGRVVFQDFALISKAIRDGAFVKNAAFLAAINHAKTHHSKLHLVGLVSSGGVHSYHEHLYALLELAAREKVPQVYVQAILDGRDTPYNSGADFLQKLQGKMSELGVGTIATIVGRFWAMDRDHHWDRIAAAYNAMVHGQAPRQATSAVEGVRACYAEAIYDEEIPPIIVSDSSRWSGNIGDNDAVIIFNFRPDRAREMTMALAALDFKEFERVGHPKNLLVVTMTEYEPQLPVQVAFPKENVSLPIAKIISEAGLKQLHVAESEKYAHVTYFFNGGRESAFPGEDRILIPSQQVISHADAPEMRAPAIAKTVVKVILEERYDFIVVNFANADMVAHTGHESATIRAVECVDSCVGEIADAVLAKEGILMITADHGNAEVILNVQTGEIDKEHNANAVPLIVVASYLHGKSVGGRDAIGGDLSLMTPAGVLADVAPTMLKLLDLPIPEDMTGRSLL